MIHRPLAPALALLALLPFTLACGDESDPDNQLGPIYDACTEGQPPDAACYAKKRDPKSANIKLATDIAVSYISRHSPEKMKWDWGDGVLMLSMVELYRVTGDARLRAYYKAWIDHHVKKGYDIVWSDSCPPALAALALSNESGAPASYKKVVDAVVSYFKTTPRTDQGGISHMGKAIPLIKTLWLDSLFMVGMPVARYAEGKGDAALLNAVGQQFQIFAAALQGKEGWLKHALNWDGQEDGVYWGRGNAWVTASGHEYLRIRRLRGERDHKVEAILKQQAAAITATQDSKSGLWWTVLNRPGKSYLETSATALFAYGLARGYRFGNRDASVLPLIQRAVAGVKGRIKKGPDGKLQVTGTSGPTTVGNASYYAGVNQEDDLHFGVGAVILSLLESSGLPASTQ